MPDFVKYHALGNDYLAVDFQQADIAASGANARLLCDRRFGIGADGVVFGPTKRVAPGEPIGLRIFNSDGSECARSGNGIRAFALYAAERYLPARFWPEKIQLALRTTAGECFVEIEDMRTGVVRIGMGIPSFLANGTARRPGTTDLAWLLEVDGRQLTVVALDNGNPHVVMPLDEISRQLAHDLGESIASHRSFATRTNVEFLRVRSPDEIDIEIWERGAGYTLASGSGACAAASVAHALGLTGDAVTVHMPGGDVQVGLGADGAVTLTGPVTAVASGEFAPSFRGQLTPRSGNDGPAEAKAMVR